LLYGLILILLAEIAFNGALLILQQFFFPELSTYLNVCIAWSLLHILTSPVCMQIIQDMLPGWWSSLGNATVICVKSPSGALRT
jgi:hypothetical protein